MLTTESLVSPRILDLLDQVTVAPGGVSAVTAGETYDEDDSPSALARTLGAVLYQTLHNGKDRPSDFAVRSFRDLGYEERLLAHTPTVRRSVRARVTARPRTQGQTVVELDGVRLQLPEGVPATDPGQVVTFDLPCARPGLSPGFLYMFGSNERSSHLHGQLLRLYAHLDDPTRSPQVWGRTVELLESLGIGWHAKVLSSQILYPRYDGLVVYLQRDGWRHARRIAETLEGTGLLGRGTSPFTAAITDGVGCAFEPSDKRGSHQGLSFGQHRANVLAQALISHATLEDDSPVAESVYAAFVDADIDPAEPARNLTSPATDVLGIA